MSEINPLRVLKSGQLLRSCATITKYLEFEGKIFIFQRFEIFLWNYRFYKFIIDLFPTSDWTFGMWAKVSFKGSGMFN